MVFSIAKRLVDLKPAPTMPVAFGALPSELLIQILSLLPTAQLLRLRRASVLFLRLCEFLILRKLQILPAPFFRDLRPGCDPGSLPGPGCDSTALPATTKSHTKGCPGPASPVTITLHFTDSDGARQFTVDLVLSHYDPRYWRACEFRVKKKVARWVLDEPTCIPVLYGITASECPFLTELEEWRDMQLYIEKCRSNPLRASNGQRRKCGLFEIMKSQSGSTFSSCSSLGSTSSTLVNVDNQELLWHYLDIKTCGPKCLAPTSDQGFTSGPAAPASIETLRVAPWKFEYLIRHPTRGGAFPTGSNGAERLMWASSWTCTVGFLVGLYLQGAVQTKVKPRTAEKHNRIKIIVCRVFDTCRQLAKVGKAVNVAREAERQTDKRRSGPFGWVSPPRGG